MISTNALARFSGFMYLILIVTGVFSLAYVPSTLVVWDNAAETVANIKTGGTLFRLGILSGLICFASFAILALSLFELLKPVNKPVARLMMILAVTAVPIAFINYTRHLDILSLLGNADHLGAIPGEMVNTRIMSLLTSFNNGNLVGEVFWGLWLLPFGWLVYRSGFLPRTLGVLLMIGCFGYLIKVAAVVVFSATNLPFYISLPGTLGEFGICLWLLIFGARGAGAAAEETVHN